MGRKKSPADSGDEIENDGETQEEDGSVGATVEEIVGKYIDYTDSKSVVIQKDRIIVNTTQVCSEHIAGMIQDIKANYPEKTIVLVDCDPSQSA